MNFSDNERLELNELCGALVDGTLDAQRRKRLAEMLAASEEARRFYVRAMSLSASLHEYASEMQSEAPDVPANERSAVMRGALGALAAAAVVVLSFWIGGFGKEGRAREAVALDKDGDESVALLSGAKNCQWRGLALKPGDILRRGQRIELVNGFAEITFDSGAQVTIEGPATLNVNSEWEAALDRGTLRAIVPAEAIGFRIANPAVDVVHPGTEFSLVADAGGAREVFVTKGSIEVQSREEAEREQSGLVLHENQARRFSVSGASDVGDRVQKLARLSRKTPLDRLIQPANYVHWSFDELHGATFPGAAIGVGSGEYAARMNAANGFDFRSLLTPGKFSGAVRFDGRVSATASFSGISKRLPRTAAFWLKVSEDEPLSKAGALLSWPGVEIGWNRNPELGSVGALKTRAGRAAAAGTTPLRDGRWHHVAVVFNPGRRPDTMHVRQYVDGRLDGAPIRRVAKKGNGRAASGSGASLPDTVTMGVSADGAFYRGEMDELFIADRALAPQEIRQLMHRNQPLRAEPLAVN